MDSAVSLTVAVWNGPQLQWLMLGDRIDVHREPAAHLRRLVTGELEAADGAGEPQPSSASRSA